MLLWSFAEREMRVVGLVNVQGPPIWFYATLWRVLQYHVFQLWEGCIMLPAPGRSNDIPESQELAVAEGGMVSPLNTQMAAFVPCCQPLGDHFMPPAPRGWLVVGELACSAG